MRAKTQLCMCTLAAKTILHKELSSEQKMWQQIAEGKGNNRTICKRRELHQTPILRRQLVCGQNTKHT